MARCIITGFDPFGGAQENPSQLAVEKLPDALYASSENPLTIEKAVLTTCCDEAWTVLQKQTAQVSQDERFLVLLSGVADGRKQICLERFALNIREYRLDDNRGHRWIENHIIPDGPEAIRTNLPLLDMVQALRDSGYMVETSNYAGAFVCNETYYRAMHKWHKDPRCVGVLFVHFPSQEQYRTAKGWDAEADVIATYAKFLEDLVHCINWE